MERLLIAAAAFVSTVVGIVMLVTCGLARRSIELLALPVDLGEGHSIHVDLAGDALLG